MGEDPMWSSRSFLSSIRIPHGSSLLVTVAVLVTAGAAGVTQQVLTRTAGPTPARAVAPQLLDTRGGEGPEQPQVPTIVLVKPGKKKKVIMADLPGFTLYTFSADGKRASKCKGACARRWRPVVSASGKPQAGGGVTLPDIGSIHREDGSFQVTFDGLPLYYFEQDRNPGDEDGTDRDEFGGKWSPEPPKGKGK
jgi:predicted lipoprotein with Yx(FWY)xxD motif